MVSYWDERPVAALRSLVKGMDTFDPGISFERILVVNRSSESPDQTLDELRFDRIVERANTGMNIGAWDAGWRVAPNATGYLFLQDDCHILRDNWLAGFVNSARPDVGLSGESMNLNWARPWDHLRRGPGMIELDGHTVNGRRVNRVDYYLRCMRKWGIDPGPDGRHLRSLVWYCRRDAIELIDGFPTGSTYGECIAPEIATSRRLLSHGLCIEQVRPDPFHFIGHPDWVYSKQHSRHVHIGSLTRLERLLAGP